MAIMVMFGCEKSDQVVAPDPKDAPVELTEDEVTSLILLNDNHEIPMTEIRRQAEEIMMELAETYNAGRTSSVITPSFKKVMRTSDETSRTQADTSALYYVVNFMDNEDADAGFAIISADNRIPGVLGYSSTGQIKEQNDNPGMKIVLGNLEPYLLGEIEKFINFYDSISSVALLKLIDDYPDSITNNLITGSEARAFVVRTVTSTNFGNWSTIENIEPLINVNWDQHPSPYNSYIPVVCDTFFMASSGCGPTAAAQIFSYHSYPTSLHEFNFNWSEMTSNKYASLINPIYQSHVSEIMHSIGKFLNTDWDCSGSSTNRDNISSGFRNMGYSISNRQDFNFIPIKKNILVDRIPVLVAGRQFKDWNGNSWDYSEGHYFDLDGYRKRKRPVYTIVESYDRFDNLVYINSFITFEYCEFVHCNFGWSGYSDDWFLPGIFDVTNPPVHSGRTLTEGREGYFQYMLEMWTDIKPN